MSIHPLTFTVLALVGSSPGLAHADAGEWRLGAGGGLVVMNTEVGGAAGTGAGYELRGRLAFGLSNLLELGVVAGYSHASDVTFARATLSGQTGTLFADESALALGLELRLTVGVGICRGFERTAPYLAVRAGSELDVRTAQTLFTPSGLAIRSVADELVVRPNLGGVVGVGRRFGDHAFLAAELTGRLAAGDRSLALTGEASWSWY